MSTPKSTNSFEASATIRPAVSHRKPKADIYTILLVVALLAVLLGILFLYLFNRGYEFKYDGAPNVVMSNQFEGRENTLLTRAEQASMLNNTFSIL